MLPKIETLLLDIQQNDKDTISSITLNSYLSGLIDLHIIKEIPC
jgi:hypothetical protein